MKRYLEFCKLNQILYFFPLIAYSDHFFLKLIASTSPVSISNVVIYTVLTNGLILARATFVESSAFPLS